MSWFRIRDMAEIRKAGFLKLSTWEILCPCPKCGKEYILSDIKASTIFKWSGRNFLPSFHNETWFRSLPENLVCVRCGVLKPEDVKCRPPIAATAIGLNMMFLLFGSIGIIVLIIFFLVNNW